MLGVGIHAADSRAQGHTHPRASASEAPRFGNVLLRSDAEASIHPLGLASWKGFAQDGTVGDMDVDDEAPWMGSRRVPAWAKPFRGAPHASDESRARRAPTRAIGSASCRERVCQYG